MGQGHFGDSKIAWSCGCFVKANKHASVNVVCPYCKFCRDRDRLPRPNDRLILQVQIQADLIQFRIDSNPEDLHLRNRDGSHVIFYYGDLNFQRSLSECNGDVERARDMDEKEFWKR